jgi:hypothetical protein
MGSMVSFSRLFFVIMPWTLWRTIPFYVAWDNPCILFVFVLAVLSLPRFPNILSIHALSPITTYRAFVYRPIPFGTIPVSCLTRRTILSTFTHHSLVFNLLNTI